MQCYILRCWDWDCDTPHATDVYAVCSSESKALELCREIWPDTVLDLIPDDGHARSFILELGEDASEYLAVIETVTLDTLIPE